MYLQELFGLELPEWTQKIYPRLLGEMVQVEFELQMKTREMRKIIVGTS